jgi:cardiolipin synthase
MFSFLVTLSLLALGIVLQVGFILQAILRPHREPSSRIAWILVILALPDIGTSSLVGRHSHPTASQMGLADATR